LDEWFAQQRIAEVLQNDTLNLEARIISISEKHLFFTKFNPHKLLFSQRHFYTLIGKIMRLKLKMLSK